MHSTEVAKREDETNGLTHKLAYISGQSGEEWADLDEGKSMIRNQFHGWSWMVLHNSSSFHLHIFWFVLSADRSFFFCAIHLRSGNVDVPYKLKDPIRAGMAHDGEGGQMKGVSLTKGTKRCVIAIKDST